MRFCRKGPTRRWGRRKKFSEQRQQQAKGPTAEKAQLVSGRMARRYVVSSKRKSEGFGINPVGTGEPWMVL